MVARVGYLCKSNFRVEIEHRSVDRIMPLNEELLRILACPVCLTPVRALADEQGLECSKCGRVYPIRDGFPVMLPEEATPATKAPQN
jgi:hypothetical protein